MLGHITSGSSRFGSPHRLGLAKGPSPNPGPGAGSGYSAGQCWLKGTWVGWGLKGEAVARPGLRPGAWVVGELLECSNDVGGGGRIFSPIWQCLGPSV